MSTERTIRYAMVVDTGEILDSEEIFKDRNQGYEKYRDQYSRNELILSCLGCEQHLAISSSKWANLHFKHIPGSSYCDLKDENLSENEIKIINDIALSKESPRHKELKRKIASRLREINAVTKDSVKEESRIERDGIFKRPDVFCMYQNREIVFEIQLSDLSNRYILSRYDFYKKNGIYLVWIFDNFDLHGQSQFHIDIKHLNDYHNFFKLDEATNKFKLICDYKTSFIKNKNEVRDVWKREAVTLEQLKFDDKNFQVFFYDFPLARKKKEEEFNEKKELFASEKKVNNIIYAIKSYCPETGMHWKKEKALIKEIESLTDKELEHINSELQLISKSSKPFINFLISKSEYQAFLKFICGFEKLKFEVNLEDDSGMSALQEILKSNASDYHKVIFIELLYRNGYRIHKGDKKLAKELIETDGLPSDELWAAYKVALCLKLDEYELIRILKTQTALFNVLFSILSIKQGEIIGYKFPNYLGLVNSFFTNSFYQEFGDIFLKAIKVYGRENDIRRLDKNGTYRKKVKNFLANKPSQSKLHHEIFIKIFPELYY